jgi:hypothetical protein
MIRNAMAPPAPSVAFCSVWRLTEEDDWDR